MKQMEYLFGYEEAHAFLTILVPGEENWTEEMWDTAAHDELMQYAKHPEAWYVAEVSEMETH